MKMVAAASSANAALPATSCSAPSAMPPPGSRSSIAAMPKGITARDRKRPSIVAMRARKESGRAGFDIGLERLGTRRQMFLVCSLMAVRVNDRMGSNAMTFAQAERIIAALSVSMLLSLVATPTIYSFMRDDLTRS